MFEDVLQHLHYLFRLHRDSETDTSGYPLLPVQSAPLTWDDGVPFVKQNDIFIKDIPTAIYRRNITRVIIAGTLQDTQHLQILV